MQLAPPLGARHTHLIMITGQMRMRMISLLGAGSPDLRWLEIMHVDLCS